MIQIARKFELIDRLVVEWARILAACSEPALKELQRAIEVSFQFRFMKNGLPEEQDFLGTFCELFRTFTAPTFTMKLPKEFPNIQTHGANFEHSQEFILRYLASPSGLAYWKVVTGRVSREYRSKKAGSLDYAVRVTLLAIEALTREIEHELDRIKDNALLPDLVLTGITARVDILRTMQEEAVPERVEREELLAMLSKTQMSNGAMKETRESLDELQKVSRLFAFPSDM